MPLLPAIAENHQEPFLATIGGIGGVHDLGSHNGLNWIRLPNRCWGNSMQPYQIWFMYHLENLLAILQNTNKLKEVKTELKSINIYIYIYVYV